MKVTIEQPATGDGPWLRVLRPDGAYDESEGAQRGAEPQDRTDRDRAENEIEAFWAGRTMAMRRSARVAA